MGKTLLVVLIAFIVGFVLFQFRFIQEVFFADDLFGIFQLSTFLILVYILHLLLNKEKE